MADDGDGVPGVAAGDPAPPHPPTEVAQPAGAPATVLPDRIIRYGPGVPARAPGPAPAAAPGQLPRTAEEAWRGRGAPAPAAPTARAGRWRRAWQPALTVVLLAASAVVFILRFAHAGGLEVTGAAISSWSRAGCEVTLTGRIATNGRAGTLSYQWQIGGVAPRPLAQSVTAGEHAVDVTARLAGAGFGSTARTVTLAVLRPGSAAAVTRVRISC